MKHIQANLLNMLQAGFNPYDVEASNDTVNDAATSLDYALSMKKDEVGVRTFKDYEGHINSFKEWLSSKYPPINIKNINKKHINLFLNSIASKDSNRTRNNYRGSLSAIFTALVECDYIEKNFILEIKYLDTKSKRDFNYKREDFEKVIKDLKDEPVLLMYINLVSFQFWRPKENCRIQRKDIDLDKRTVKAFVKQGVTKTKYIPTILFEDLETYLKDAKEDYLYSLLDVPTCRCSARNQL